MPNPNFYMKHLIGCGSDEGEACDCGMIRAIECLIDLRNDKKRLEADLAEAKVQHSIVMNGLLEQIDALKGGET